MGFLSAVELLRNGLGFYQDARGFYKEGRNISEIYQKLTTVSVESRKELLEGVLSSKLDYKDHIKIQGKLIDYAHLYKPKSYINSLDQEGDLSEKSEMEKGRELVLSWSWKPFQLPISKVPSVSTESGEMSLSFLYPAEFESFIYPGVNGFIGGPLSEPSFDVPLSAKPIPILLAKEDAVKYQFQNVEVTGRIVPLPDNLVRKFIDNPFSSMTFSDIVNPLNTKVPSLCLNLNTNKGNIKKVNNGNVLQDCKASIFMETHIEGNVNDTMLSKIPDIASKSLLGKADRYSLAKDQGDKEATIFQLSTQDNIKVIGKFPNILGFYFEGNLINLEDDYKNFAKVFNQFTTNMEDRVPALRMHVDFMHDYNLKSYLNSPILNSKSGQALNNNLQETAQWLKK